MYTFTYIFIYIYIYIYIERERGSPPVLGIPVSAPSARFAGSASATAPCLLKAGGFPAPDPRSPPKLERAQGSLWWHAQNGARAALAFDASCACLYIIYAWAQDGRYTPHASSILMCGFV